MQDIQTGCNFFAFLDDEFEFFGIVEIKSPRDIIYLRSYSRELRFELNAY
jgi:hypothetical protein